MKDYIEVYDKDNNKEKVEVILSFKYFRNHVNYIVYRSLKNNQIYAGRYDPTKLVGKLETDLSDNEKKIIETELRGVL